MEIIQAVLFFAGGLGMFLYGMEIMAEGLQQAAGDKTRKLLESLVSNPFLGLLCGALVTAVIQSSSAATVMVVGFVNAGLMNLTQACSVIMGANIGTTMTAWIVSMGEWAAFLKPEMIAPILLLSGVVLHMSAHSGRVKDGAKILIGFGILFTGLSTMSSAVNPFVDAPVFREIFVVLGSNPVFGILAGMAVTAIIQSSSASLGILQTLAAAGLVNWSAAVYIALGQNIGTCVTAMLSSLSGSTNAKRAAMIHLEFNVIGAVICAIGAAAAFIIWPSLGMSQISATSLALFHTCFNIGATAILFPFRRQLVSLSKVLVPHHEKKSSAVLLDSRFQSLPNAALQAVSSQLEMLKESCVKLVGKSRTILVDDKNTAGIEEKASAVFAQCVEVQEYLSGMDTASMSEQEQQRAMRYLLVARDLHGIALECLMISRLPQNHPEMKFSEEGVEDINTMSSLCEEALKAIEKQGGLSRIKRREKADAVYEQIAKLAAGLRDDAGRKPESSLWLLLDAADRYESIGRRILRAANEDDWLPEQLLPYTAQTGAAAKPA